MDADSLRKIASQKRDEANEKLQKIFNKYYDSLYPHLLAHAQKGGILYRLGKEWGMGQAVVEFFEKKHFTVERIPETDPDEAHIIISWAPTNKTQTKAS